MERQYTVWPINASLNSSCAQLSPVLDNQANIEKKGEFGLGAGEEWHTTCNI